MATGTGVTSVKNQWTNADGLTVNFTPQGWSSRVGGEPRVTSEEAIRYAVFNVDLTKIGNGLTGYPDDLNNDGTTDGFDDGKFSLPPGSSVVRVTWVTTEAAVGGTSWVLGTYLQDGTIVSANNLMTATEAVTANAASVGARIFGAGAYVSATAGTAGTGTVPEYIAAKVTGTFTAGKGRVVIEYIPSTVG